jgi:hypothetical protein
MSEEKLNSTWKQKLEDANSLSHATLQNKDDAWEKLHARLAEKPGSKRIAWYWIAAACLLFVVIISSLAIHTSTTSLVKNSTTNTTNDTLKNKIVQKSEAVETLAKEITTVQKRQQMKKNIVVENTEHDIKTSDIVNVNPLANNNNETLQNETIAMPITVDTTAIATISPAPVQKKLKVVHVNELGEPVEFPIGIAHNTDLHLFQLKLAQQEIYNATSIAENYQPFLSHKPKNSSN